MQIIAHRGASKIAPENTLPAFKLAEKLGAESIETDIHLTKDQVPVLIHDPRLERTTNGRGFVKDYTFVELQELDAGSWFSEQYEHTQIISLAEFLEWIQLKKLHINLELKNKDIRYKFLEDIVYEHIEYYQVHNRTIISTFNPESIQYMANLNQSIPLALLRSKKHQNLAKYAETLGAASIHINYRLLNKRLMKQCKRNHTQVRVYTVNKFEQMIRCFSHRCHGIFTDVPGKALYHRQGYLLNQLF